MSTMTPKANQIRIQLLGLRNAGKSSLMNSIFGEEVAIVSDIPGTTTDPVSKSIELGDLGACLIHDTAGIDDEGRLGSMRVRRTLSLVEHAHIIVFVTNGNEPLNEIERSMINEISTLKIPFLIALTHADEKADKIKRKELLKYTVVECDNNSGFGIDTLKEEIISFKDRIEYEITALEGLVNENDLLFLVTPIDLAAPKERLIQPQVAVIRDCLDRDCASLVVKERELKHYYDNLGLQAKLVITDSQAFNKVAADIPDDQPLTSFSILFARKKGDLPYYTASAQKMKTLEAGSTVLIMESCSHHRQADDIGTVKIPRLFRQLIQSDVNFIFHKEMPEDEVLEEVSLVISCASCMISRTQVLNRLNVFKSRGIPVVNYGIFLAFVNGLMPRAIEMFPEAMLEYAKVQNVAVYSN